MRAIWSPTDGHSSPTGTSSASWSSSSRTSLRSLAVERLDVSPLALYLKHLAHWAMERDRGDHVERVVQTLLDRSARGLGLEGTR